MTHTILAHLTDINLAFGNTLVLNDLNAHIETGLNWLTGGECSGKTSVLRLLSGQLAPTSGAVAYAFGTSPQVQVCFIDPANTQYDSLTVSNYFAAHAQRYAAFDAQLCADLIEAFDLSPHLGKNIYMLSAGSKRKVWLTAALASGADITCIDAPYTALDAASISIVNDILVDAAQHTARAWVVADYEVPSCLQDVGHIVDLSA